mgnify:CR=1 FL=1|jgi:hypothetical protein
MATTLINTRKAIMPQIHASWNQFRSTDKAMVLMFGEVGSNYRDYHEIPLAKDFSTIASGCEEPWSTKQSVLERNMVHANNLIRLYIALNIEIEHRMPIWQFFEIGTGIVGKIKEQIHTLKRVTKVLKKQQQYCMNLSNATDMFLNRGNCGLYALEEELKDYPQKMKEIKAAKKRNAALRRAKKGQAKKDAAKKKKNAKKKKALKRTDDWIEANKQGKNVAKRDILKRLKVADKEGHTIADVIAELERQLQ